MKTDSWKQSCAKYTLPQSWVKWSVLVYIWIFRFHLNESYLIIGQNSWYRLSNYVVSWVFNLSSHLHARRPMLAVLLFKQLVQVISNCFERFIPRLRTVTTKWGLRCSSQGFSRAWNAPRVEWMCLRTESALVVQEAAWRCREESVHSAQPPGPTGQTCCLAGQRPTLRESCQTTLA